MRSGTTAKTTKRYPRMTAGPLRNQYVHRIVAAALLGRELSRDEEVHHRDNDRRNCWFTNLWVIGEVDHGWVSAKQHWFMNNRDDKLKAEWDTFMAEEAQRFTASALQDKTTGIPHEVQDGQLQRRWESRNGKENRQDIHRHSTGDQYHAN